MRAAIVLLAALVASGAPPVRPVPPPGIEVSAKDQEELLQGLSRLAAAAEGLKGSALLPDVRIFHEAVRSALTYGEFFKPDEIGRARELLRQGLTRAEELAAGRASWTTATGLIVRGYSSKIDGSVQPYALVVPSSFDARLPRRWRLDAWFHGRSETLSEVNFLYDRQRSAGEFTPPDTLVLHLYGRYCNANKFAGEVDLFEALDAVRRAYPIDENRISVRGFSMGGAATWHIAAHHAGLWAAAAPGAGFAETPAYLKLTPEQIAAVPAWERTLWHLYNATDYAANLFNVPIVAYSGELDPQKQAAGIMAKHMAEEGLTLRHVIGPDTAHRYHPEAKKEISAIVDAVVEKGRDPYPSEIRFTTWTLRYNRMKWVVIDGLERHWERARLDARVEGDGVHFRTANVSAFHVDAGPGSALVPGKTAVVIDGTKVEASGSVSDGSWNASFVKTDGRWRAGALPDTGLRKQHGLQGPIDDAFYDSFVFVLPSGESNAWVKAESQRAIREWRRQWRGEARVKLDTQLTDEDIGRSNLVVWGSPSDNKVLARAAAGLPVKWTGSDVAFAGATYPGATHVPILIYPNPLNPRRYIVVNSGPTQREADLLTNSRQVPRLPDYAIVDTTTPPDERNPGRIVRAGFFNESWQP